MITLPAYVPPATARVYRDVSSTAGLASWAVTPVA